MIAHVVCCHAVIFVYFIQPWQIYQHDHSYSNTTNINNIFQSYSNSLNIMYQIDIDFFLGLAHQAPGIARTSTPVRAKEEYDQNSQRK